jgi:hypothetical protein
MLSLQECRKILGSSCTLSDSALEQYRDDLYAFADIAYEAIINNTQPSQSILPPQNQTVSSEEMFKLVTKDQQEDVIERSAIMEYDSGLQREDAERNVLSKHYGKNGLRN